MKQAKQFFRNPLVRRVLVWLAPIIVGWIMERLTRSDTSKTTSNKSKKK